MNEQQKILQMLGLENIMVENSMGFLRELAIVTNDKDNISLKILPLDNPSTCIDIK